MISTEANDSLDIEKACLAMIIIGAFSVIGGIAGCYGAWSEHRGAICGFACFLVAVGATMFGVMLQMRIFFNSVVPTLIKETNRLCRNPAHTKKVLQCPQVASDAYQSQ